MAKSYSHTALEYLRSWFKKEVGGDNAVEGDATDTVAPSANDHFIGNAKGRGPVAPNAGFKSGTFVDDTTMIMWAKENIEGDNSDLPHIAYEVSSKWTDLVTNDLLLDTSDKNRFLPPGPAANAALAGCQANNCTAAVGTHGKDLGVDTVADGKRDDRVLKGRAVAAAERTERHAFLVKTMASSGLGSSMSKRHK